MPPVRSISSAQPRVDADTFDLVLDLRAEPAFTMHQPPQGYFHAGRDERRPCTKAVLELRDAVRRVREAEVLPLRARSCARTAATSASAARACIDVCSARAIRSDASLKGKTQGKAARRTGARRLAGAKPAGGIVVEPHLCVGCGACSTVCPSGAICVRLPGHGRPGQAAAHAAARVRGGRRPRRGAADPQRRRRRAARRRAGPRARAPTAALHGVPARVLPLALWHTASVGIDLWLSAFAQGANQVWVLLSDEEAPRVPQRAGRADGGGAGAAAAAWATAAHTSG